MNLYLDASAFVKRYLSEPGTPETRRIIEGTEIQGTAIITRTEVSAALAKTARTQVLTREEARSALEAFYSDWPNVAQQQVTETVVTRAARLAWDENLRGYDAVQLASALVWKEGLAEDVIFAIFDVELWEAAGQHALVRFPEDLRQVLNTWKRQ